MGLTEKDLEVWANNTINTETAVEDLKKSVAAPTEHIEDEPSGVKIPLNFKLLIEDKLKKAGKYDVCRAVQVIEQHQQRRKRVCILPHISIKTATALKDLGYKLSPRLMDKNEEFYYKVYLV